jgi:hypothetical protein
MEVLMSRHEAHSRSLAKAVTWRLTATIDTFLISLIVTGEDRYRWHYCRQRNWHQDFDLLFP